MIYFWHKVLSIFQAVSTARMKIIGLVGGVASGKSLRLNMPRRIRSGHLDADPPAMPFWPKTPCSSGLIDRWGNAILDADGLSTAPPSPTSVRQVCCGAADRKFLETAPPATPSPQISSATRPCIGKPAIVLMLAIIRSRLGSLCDVSCNDRLARELRLSRAATRAGPLPIIDEPRGAQRARRGKTPPRRCCNPNYGLSTSFVALIAQFWAQNIASANHH